MPRTYRSLSPALEGNALARPAIHRHRILGGVAAAATVCALLAPALPAYASSDTSAAPEAMTQQRIDAANNAYNGADATLEFITMSDTELGGNATETKPVDQVSYEAVAPHFARINAWAKAKSFDPEVVVDNGDVVGANDPEYAAHLKGDSAKVAGWYTALERVMRENFPDAQVLLTQGNHDIADLMGKTFESLRDESDPAWFYPNAATGYVSNFHTTVGGIDFIGLDYNGKETFGYGGQRTGYQQFLRDTLAGIAAKPGYDAKKPIFVNIHSGYSGTSLGGPFHGVYDLAGPDLQKILADYPQAVLGSAHTHFSLNPETSIFQKDFTVYENASMNYIYQDVPSDFIGGGYFGGNQGDPAGGIGQLKSANFITVLESGETVIRRFDVTHNRWMGMPWVVDTTKGKAGFTYTDDKRSKTAPWWQAAAINTSNVTETSLTLGFDQASDDELVNYYEVEISDQNGAPVQFAANQVPDFGANAAKSFSGKFKAYSRFYMTPNTMAFDLTGLKAATNYRVRVTAFDDFQNKSVALEGSFRTAGTLVLPEFPEVTPAPTGEFLHMAFDGDLSDDGAAASNAPTAAPVGSVSYVASDREGATDQAVRIAGGAGSYVNLGSRPEFDLGTDKDLTVSLWAKVTSVSGYGAIISNKNWANWYRSGINLAPQGADTSKLEFTLGDGVNGVYATGDVANYRGSWHLMTLTVDRERNIASTYFDGKLAKETSISSIGSMTSGLSMLLGVDGSKSYGAGLDVDDLRMWSSALTEAEIASLFSADNTTAEVEALTTTVQYADELVAANAVKAENGQVFDEDLAEALDGAISGARAALAPGSQTLEAKGASASAQAAAPTREALRQAYNSLRAAIEGVEAQQVRFVYAAEGVHGTVTPASGVVNAAGTLTLQLAPEGGYSVANAEVTVSGAEGFEVEGEQLVISGVQQRVLVSVTFAQSVGSGADGGSSGSGGGNAGSGSGGGTAGSGTGSAGGAQGGQLTNTGSSSPVGWGLGALTALALGGATVLFSRRTAKRADAVAAGDTQ